MKQGRDGILKAIAGVAGVVFLLTPITDMGISESLVALVIAIAAGVAGSRLGDDEENATAATGRKALIPQTRGNEVESLG
jgi:hypothetical protein